MPPFNVLHRNSRATHFYDFFKRCYSIYFAFSYQKNDRFLILFYDFQKRPKPYLLKNGDRAVPHVFITLVLL